MPETGEDEDYMPNMPEREQHGHSLLPFPPVTKAHILNCAYHCWHPKYRAITPKSRIIPLPEPFLDYLRADGIILPDDDDGNDARRDWSDDDSGIFSASDHTGTNGDNTDSDDDAHDIAADWRSTHESIRATIAELGGNVVPKLNWSAPKDATWMNANSMECRSPNDVYLLLKSSDFITHDLEHAFDDCIDSPDTNITQADIPFHLVLRKYVQFNPSVEFRCFVRGRKLLALCQRDLNHFDFLFAMQGRLCSLIQEFFDVRLRDTFPEENFVFDVYVPAPQTKVWLVDINPWAPRTDPLLFSWLEILTMPDPPAQDLDEMEGFVRLSLRPTTGDISAQALNGTVNNADVHDDEENSASDTDSSVDEDIWLPELRLVKKSDAEAYSFSTPQYSAHKLPKDVVDASQSGEGLREFARDWENIQAERRRQQEELADSSDEE